MRGDEDAEVSTKLHKESKSQNMKLGLKDVECIPLTEGPMMDKEPFWVAYIAGMAKQILDSEKGPSSMQLVIKVPSVNVTCC
jgi:hypothetical protein